MLSIELTDKIAQQDKKEGFTIGEAFYEKLSITLSDYAFVNHKQAHIELNIVSRIAIRSADRNTPNAKAIS